MPQRQPIWVPSPNQESVFYYNKLLLFLSSFSALFHSSIPWDMTLERILAQPVLVLLSSYGNVCSSFCHHCELKSVLFLWIIFWENYVKNHWLLHCQNGFLNPCCYCSALAWRNSDVIVVVKYKPRPELVQGYFCLIKLKYPWARYWWIAINGFLISPPENWTPNLESNLVGPYWLFILDQLSVIVILCLPAKEVQI